MGRPAGGVRISGGEMRSSAARIASRPALQRYPEGDTAGSYRKDAILDAFHFGDLVDEPHAGDGEHDAECQGEPIDDHSMAIVLLLLPGALIFLQIRDGARVEFCRRFVAGRAVLQRSRGTLPKRDYAARFRWLPLLRAHRRLDHARCLARLCRPIAARLSPQQRTATPGRGHGEPFPARAAVPTLDPQAWPATRPGADGEAASARA